jgi:hypothetical protein
VNEMQSAHKKRCRGAILRYVHLNREEQGSRMDDTQLWGLLHGLRFDVGQAEILALLQDLQERECLHFVSTRNRWSGRTEISRITITSRGCDLVERTIEDPAILIP